MSIYQTDIDKAEDTSCHLALRCATVSKASASKTRLLIGILVWDFNKVHMVTVNSQTVALTGMANGVCLCICCTIHRQT